MDDQDGCFGKNCDIRREVDGAGTAAVRTEDGAADDVSAVGGSAIRPRRRAVLLGVGGLGAAAALAACGASGGAASAPPAASGGGGPSPSAGGPTTGGTGSGTGDTGSGGSSGGAAAAGGLTSTTAIPVGGGKVFTDQLVVVTQPSAGSFKAFTATCTHQGCTVNQVSNGLIICPCHGSEYSIVDGSVKQGPAPSPLAEKKITVANGRITLS